MAVLRTQFSKSETKTCSLEIECWLTGEADSAVGGSVAIPVSLEGFLPSSHTQHYTGTRLILWRKAFEIVTVDSCWCGVDNFGVS